MKKMATSIAVLLLGGFMLVQNQSQAHADDSCPNERPKQGLISQVFVQGMVGVNCYVAPVSPNYVLAVDGNGVTITHNCHEFVWVREPYKRPCDGSDDPDTAPGVEYALCKCCKPKDDYKMKRYKTICSYAAPNKACVPDTRQVLEESDFTGGKEVNCRQPENGLPPSEANPCQGCNP